MSPPTLSELAPQFIAIAGYWWIWLPILLGFILVQSWLTYVRAKFKASIRWSLLEIRVPRELKKTPKAMEQIFAGLYGLRNKADNIIETYVDGEVTLWFSFEIASFSGDIHFYVRTPTKHRHIIEAVFYAHYPDLEILEVSDYMATVPKSMQEMDESGYSLWGSELRLAREDAYPIRTYAEFSSTVEEEQIDPVSALVEILGKAKRGEKILLQILVRPADDTWQLQGKKLLDKLKTSNIHKKTKVMPGGDVEEVEKMIARTPGEVDLLKAINLNISKPGFETIIRYMYLAPKDIFSTNLARRGVFSCFNQYADFRMNFFRQNSGARTETWWVKSPYIFPEIRLRGRKRRMLRNFRERRMPEESFFSKIATSEVFDWNVKSKTFVLNTEELATIWHLPSHLVLTAPFVQRVESRKIGPPAGLPIFGGEEETPWTKKKK
ncbi:MAG: hypothetical protein Q7S09_03240 [bacterium]|nr:hypothetical protein [bacterium]